ncbi:MAG TPA: hypothetical protein VLI94_01435 [Solirubrobacterales bacterium]|nr:hypothetical protein [Solirubrobacterales bacterium]
MPLPALRRIGLLALLAVAAVAGTATGALVEVDDVVLRADGGFQPQTLPRQRYAPIEFHGRVDISGRNGRPVPVLKQALISFDRDGRLGVAGLPTCAPDSIDEANTAQARATCRGAIVGTGEVGARIGVPGGSVAARSDLTVFNGPRLAGVPTAILHARLSAPVTETYAIVVPIERRGGAFRYRARLDLPPIAGGAGVITHVDVEIGRRYRAGGRQRSYVSARCSDNILETHGRFTFEDGTIIDGLVEKYCHSK